MANDLNLCVIQGNLVRDPETKFTTSGTAVCNCTIASNRKFKDQEPETAFIDVTVWGKLAEVVVGPYAKKGDRVIVTGRIKQDSWVDKESGQKRSKLGLVAENFQLPLRARNAEQEEFGAGVSSEPIDSPF